MKPEQERVVNDLSGDEIAQLVKLAERLIGAADQGRWWEPKPSASFRVALATMVVTVATHKQVAEIHKMLEELV